MLILSLDLIPLHNYFSILTSLTLGLIDQVYSSLTGILEFAFTLIILYSKCDLHY